MYALDTMSSHRDPDYDPMEDIYQLSSNTDDIEHLVTTDSDNSESTAQSESSITMASSIEAMLAGQPK